MFLLLALLHALLLLTVLLFQVLELLLVLLLHLLSALVVGSLLVRAPALLGLLLFDALALLILLSPHVLQLLLMLQLKLRIAIRRRIVRRPSCRRSIVWPVIARRPIGLSVAGPLGVRRRRVLPLVLIWLPHGRWTITTLVVRALVRWRRVWPLSVRRTIRLIRLHIIGPLGIRRWRVRALVLIYCGRSLRSLFGRSFGGGVFGRSAFGARFG